MPLYASAKAEGKIEYIPRFKFKIQFRRVKMCIDV